MSEFTKARKGDPCTIEGCGKPVLGRGWCSMHYARWRFHGDPLSEMRRYVRQGDKCAHEGCESKPKRRGLCETHARLQIKYGTTMDPRERKFWAQVDKRGPDECWPWTGYMQYNGYGVRSTHRRETRLAHRIAYEYVIGPIPDGLVLDHLCHTRDPQCADVNECPHRRCCNPEHLEPVTRRENIARGRGGDSWGYVPEPVQREPEQLALAVCVNGCAKPVYKSGKCRPCYRKWLKDPAVERPSQRTVEQRFWSKVEKTDTCWLWTASINQKTRYGHFARRHGDGVDAHRFSYELAHGPIPAGLDVHHKCWVRHCVNPAHLEAMTRAQNTALRKYRRT